MAKVLEKVSNYSYRGVKSSERTMPCPRFMNDVYSEGIDIQYYIGDIYLQLAEISRGEIKKQYKKMALMELEVKQEIEKVNNARLNELLGRFYNSGGAIIEPPLSEKQYKAIQPFINRIMENFTEQVESLLVLAADGSISPTMTRSMIDHQVIEMYANISKLFKVDEIVKAYDVLIKIKDNGRKS